MIDTEEIAKALAELDEGDLVDLQLVEREDAVQASVSEIDVRQDGLAGHAERVITLQTFGGERIRAVVVMHRRPATMELSHATVGDHPGEWEYVRIRAVEESGQRTLQTAKQQEVES